jgi:Leucine-rich repeat (LRR) protein
MHKMTTLFLFQRWVFAPLFLIFSLFTVTATAQNEVILGPVELCSHPDYPALMSLYASTNGDEWLNNTGWAEGAQGDDCDLCKWFGVTCTNNRVSRLLLDGNNLSGSLPDEIGALSELRHLWLRFNNLTGNIPGSIVELDNLEYLFLSNNALTGTLPPSLASAPLRYLMVSDNHLTGGIPNELGSIHTLEYLHLANNQLNGTIPPALGQLSNLVSLNLEHNNLTGGLPASFSNLTNLIILLINNNALNGTIETDFSALDNLTSLWLQVNALTGPIPPSLAEADNLGFIRLQNNQLTGPIPAALAELPSLISFNVADNQLSDCADNLTVWCTTDVNYNFSGNLMLPYYGIASLICQNDPATPAPCDPDGDPNTTDEGVVNEFCECVPVGGVGGGTGSKAASLGKVPSATTNSLIVYPNPVAINQEIHLQLPALDAPFTLSLCNASGREVLRQTLRGIEGRLPLNGLPAGMYFLSVRSTTGQWVEKLILY